MVICALLLAILKDLIIGSFVKPQGQIPIMEYLPSKLNHHYGAISVLLLTLFVLHRHQRLFCLLQMFPSHNAKIIKNPKKFNPGVSLKLTALRGSSSLSTHSGFMWFSAKIQNAYNLSNSFSLFLMSSATPSATRV
jgi:hypothetical protein